MDPGIPQEVPDRPQFHERRGDDIIPSRPRLKDVMGDKNVLYHFLAGWADATNLRNREEPRDEAARQWEYNVDEDIRMEEETLTLYFLNGHAMTREELFKRLEDIGG